MERKIRIGAMISGGGTNLQAIIDACESENISAEMVFVGTDNPDAAGLARAERHSIPSFVVDYRTIIQQYKKTPEVLSPPTDFDLDEIWLIQNLFEPDAPATTLEAFITTRAIAEAKLL